MNNKLKTAHRKTDAIIIRENDIIMDNVSALAIIRVGCSIWPGFSQHSDENYEHCTQLPRARFRMSLLSLRPTCNYYHISIRNADKKVSINRLFFPSPCV